MKSLLRLPLLLLVATTLPVQAGIILTMQQSGSDVLLTSSGSLGEVGVNVTPTVDTINAAMTPFFASLTTGTGLQAIGGNVARYAGVLSGPSSFGTFVVTAASSSSGSILGIIGASHDLALDVFQVFNSQPPTAGSSTWSGSTLSSLGVNPGTYTWTVSGTLFVSGNPDTVVLNIVDPAAVPEPAPLALMLAGLAGIRAVRRQRRPRG